ncbi:MAG: hypothetical protein QNJ26_21080 [Desulfobacterales bacterium]|nr:hypothetical protein [Desulfobacterales bacterium]
MPAPEVEKTNFFKNMISMNRVLMFLAVLILAGCAAGNYGYLRHSRDVTQAFESFHVYPQHRYYYLNQENNPYAVVALQNNYRLVGHMWAEFDPYSEKLEKVTGLIKDFAYAYSRPYGSYILDQSQNPIGYWYSSLEVKSLNVDGTNQYVSIYTDMPWLRDDDRPIRGFGIGVGR